MPFRKIKPAESVNINTGHDTDGHAARSGHIEPADHAVDTEGHVARNGRIEPADDAVDTEGHVIRPGRIEPAGGADGA